MRTTLFWSMRIAAIATALGIAVVAAAALVPKALGYDPIVVINGSMEPEMPLGSVALTKMVPVSDIGVGDIITFTPDGAEIPTTHRVVEAQIRNGKKVFTTKGDANDTIDEERVVLDSPDAPRVEHVIPYIGWIIERAKTPVGAALLFLLPIGGLLFDKPARGKKGEPSEPSAEEARVLPASDKSGAAVARAEAAVLRVESAAARTEATLARLELWVERVEGAAKRTEGGTKQRVERSPSRPVELTSPPPAPARARLDGPPRTARSSPPPPPPPLRVVGQS